jgi:hypothetical protein
MYMNCLYLYMVRPGGHSVGIVRSWTKAMELLLLLLLLLLRPIAKGLCIKQLHIMFMKRTLLVKITKKKIA